MISAHPALTASRDLAGLAHQTTEKPPTFGKGVPRPDSFLAPCSVLGKAAVTKFWPLGKLLQVGMERDLGNWKGWQWNHGL